ncbi:hypothetical protein, partial [Escherichia coli]|uniref:hypothetical protein n=1 Tax=Escherichia coli TaxID=562 RepID=UPI0024DF45FB
PSGKNIIRWLLKKRTNGSVRYCQYTSCLMVWHPAHFHFSPIQAGMGDSVSYPSVTTGQLR